MPRQARIDAPGALHHIIARGMERGVIFRNKRDRDDFLRRLGAIIKESETLCYAWALIPNHFHLLLKTGNVPLASVMRRLLSGYAGSFNHRYDRSGHLFQNRYKSILCQEDVYLRELVRYIHLNPLRAGIVGNLEELDRYRYCGHSGLMGNYQDEWQETRSVLKLFGDPFSSARMNYRAFVEDGMAQGRREDLVGGGLVRSAGGWQAVAALRKGDVHLKSDERMLGDSDFVEDALSRAKERYENRFALAAKGIGYEQLAQWVSELTAIPLQAMAGAGKERQTVRARSILCYWAVRELGMSLTDLSNRLSIAAPTVSVAVQRGKKIADREKLGIEALLNVKI